MEEFLTFLSNLQSKSKKTSFFASHVDFQEIVFFVEMWYFALKCFLL